MKRRKYFEERACSKITAAHPTTGKEITVDFQRDAKIGADLDEELVRFPGTVSWYLQLRDNAEGDLDDARHHEHNVAEETELEMRKLAEDEGKKPTETQLKTMVRAHPKMRRAYRRRMNAERVYRALKSAVEALIEKKWAMKALVDYRRIDNNKDGF